MGVYEILGLLFMLLCAHALCDFPLQTPEIGKGKNRNRPIDPAMIPPGQKIDKTVWIHYMSAHAAIHGGAVSLVTGFWIIGLLEFVAHWTIDFFKCENKYGIFTDQMLHIGCKAVWVILVVIKINAVDA